MSFRPTTPHHLPTRALSLKSRIAIVLGATAFLLLACTFYISMPLLVLLTPKQELTNWMPKKVRCAPCTDIARENMELAEQMCMGLGDGDGKRVLMGGFEGCWVRRRGRDEWDRRV